MPRQNYKIPIPIPEKERKKRNKRREKKRKPNALLDFTFSIPMGEDLPLPAFPSHPSLHFSFHISLFACLSLRSRIFPLSFPSLFFFLIFLFTVPIKLLCQCPSQSLIMINNQNASPFRKSNSLFKHFIFSLFSHPQNDTIFLQHQLREKNSS